MTEEIKDISPHFLNDISLDEVMSRLSSQKALNILSLRRDLPEHQRKFFEIFIRYFYLHVYSQGFEDGRGWTLDKISKQAKKCRA